MKGCCRPMAALVLATAVAPLGACHHAVASNVPSPPAAAVPFRLVEQFLVVVNGSIGDLRDLNLVIDTGTYTTVVDDRIARRLRAPRRRETMQVFGENVITTGVTLPWLRVGPLIETELPVLVADLEAQTEWFGLTVDALVGMDLLRGRCLTIDYAAGWIGLECADTWPARASLDPDAPYPVVEASINGTPYRLLLDSGSEAILIFESTIPAGATITPAGEVNATHVNGTTRLTWFRPYRVGLGEQTLGTPPVFIMKGTGDAPEYDGVLGTRWLSDNKVCLDFARLVVSWQ